jgi:hypothetical protein
MKGKTMIATLLIGGAVAAGAVYPRLAPSDPARWHVSPAPQTAPPGQVVPLSGGATLYLGSDKGAPADLLARLDTVAMASPRTTRLAGSLDEGRITWITRSALWGFPDYTTAEARADGLYIHARLRFGQSDMGVNAKRLTDWAAAL